MQTVKNYAQSVVGRTDGGAETNCFMMNDDNCLDASSTPLSWPFKSPCPASIQ